ncbi:12217_t:CDS:1, partial [Racocetra fulgida]
METWIIDPYSFNDPIKIDLYDDINLKQIGFVPKKIFENKIIGIANRKVQIYDLFHDFKEYLPKDFEDKNENYKDDFKKYLRKYFKEYLREYFKDKNDIHLLSIMDEILFNIKKSKGDISGVLKDDTELITVCRGKLVTWKYDKNHENKMKLSASRSGDNTSEPSDELNVVDVFLKKNSLDPLNILAFELLSNDELMIMAKWYHEGLEDFTIVVALDHDDKIQIKYFFNTNYLINCSKIYKMNESFKDPSEELSEELLEKTSEELSEELSEKLSEKQSKELSEEKIEKLVKKQSKELTDKYLSKILFSVKYFEFIIKHLELEFFKSDNSLNNLITSHVEDISFFKLYAQNLLIAAILEHRIDLVDQVFNQCMKLIEDNPDEINVLKIITPYLHNLYESYPGHFNKFISQTSLLLSPSHRSIDYT